MSCDCDQLEIECNPCHTCNECECNCTCEVPDYINTGCLTSDPSDCVTYVGPDFPDLGIGNGDSLTTVLVKVLTWMNGFEIADTEYITWTKTMVNGHPVWTPTLNLAAICGACGATVVTTTTTAPVTTTTTTIPVTTTSTTGPATTTTTTIPVTTTTSTPAPVTTTTTLPPACPDVTDIQAVGYSGNP